MRSLTEHADALEAINRDLNKRHQQHPDGQLAHCIYTIRRTIDHLNIMEGK